MITTETSELEQEIWKDIKGYEGLYQVSNLGRIKSLYFINNRYKSKHHREKIMKQQINKHGYKTVRLSLNKKEKSYMVHRLVAEAFILNTKNKLEVNHIDGNKQNNRVDNLELCTRSENQLHAYQKGLQKITNKMKENSIKLGQTYGKINGSKTWKTNIKKAIEKRKIKVNQYSLNGKFLKTWNSITEASKNTGTHKSNICACTKGKRKSGGGYKWKIA